MPRPTADRSAAPHAALGVYAAAVAVLTAAFLVRYPVPEFLAKAAASVSALWFSWALVAAGRVLRRATRTGAAADLGRWTGILTDFAFGLGAVGTTALILGWAIPGDLRAKLRGLFALLFAVSLAELINSRGRIVNSVRSALRWDAPAAVAVLPAAGAIVSLLSSFTPITHYDSLVYHLALPAMYLRDGAITAIPFNLYSTFPAVVEMNFMVILATLPAPEYVINVWGWILAFLLGASVSEWGARIGGRFQSWLCTIVWWTAPMILLLSQGAYVDVPLAAATFLAVRWYVAGRESGAPAPLALSGLMAGLAFSIKYTGGMTFAFIAVDLAVRCARGRLPWKSVTPVVAASAVFPIAWLIKNALTVGNPVFPFLYRALGGNVGWTSATADGYFRMLTEYNIRSNVLIDLLTGAWRIGGPAQARGGFDVLGDFGWPIVFFAAPLAVFFRRDHPEIKWLSLYAVAHVAAWYLSKPVLRFLIGLFPIGVVLATSALQILFQERRKAVRVVAIALTVPWIVSNVFMYGLAAGELRLFTVPFGKLGADQFLRQRLAYYPIYSLLNEQLPPGVGVLVIGEQRTYHLDTPFVTSNLFAPSPIAAICNRAPDAADIREALRRMGIGAILLNEAEVSRLGGLMKFGFNSDGESSLRSFLNESARIAAEDRGVFLYEINPV